MPANYCPHCGEDVRLAVDAAPPAPAAAAPDAAEPKLSVVKREVTSKEIREIWGDIPLPHHIAPFGMVVGPDQAPVALAAGDNDGGRWALAAGEVRMLGDVGIPEMPAADLTAAPPVTPTVPAHICNTDGQAAREKRGQERYGK